MKVKDEKKYAAIKNIKTAVGEVKSIYTELGSFPVLDETGMNAFGKVIADMLKDLPIGILRLLK